MSEIKRKLYQHCIDFVEKRIAAARETIAMAQESANEDTKSSAGDKYETGRAMAQLEIEKTAGQLEEALKDKKVLDSINIKLNSKDVQQGSLVITDNGNFFLAISVGVMAIDGKSVAIVSPQSPIGKLLFGRKVGDAFTFGPRHYRIAAIE